MFWGYSLSRNISTMKIKLSLLVFLVCVLTAQWSEASEPVASKRDSLPERWLPCAVFNQTLPAEDEWWNVFGDSTLTVLIEKGQKYNYNVAGAVKRIKIAQTQLSALRASYYPTLSASAGWQGMRSSGRTTAQRVESGTVTYFSAGLDMQWEIDVFGRVQAQAKAQKAAVGVSVADYEATMVSVAANIAKAYFQLRMYEQQLDVAQRHIESQQHIVDIATVRQQTGLASGLDVSQARQVLLSTQATVSGIKEGVKTSLNALAVLTGCYPSDLQYLLEGTDSLPVLPDVPAVGVPADILRRRPDVVAAELELQQYAAQIGISRKDFLPTLSLTASVGTDAHRADKLFSSDSYAWSVAPQISWTVFDGFARNYKTAEARMQFETGVDNYNMVLLTVYQEVENAMTSYSCALETISCDKDLLAQADKSMSLSLELYKEGLTGFSNVADAQISTLESRNSLISAHANALTSLVTLYQALGGGWNGNMIND